MWHKSTVHDKSRHHKSRNFRKKLESNTKRSCLAFKDRGDIWRTLPNTANNNLVVLEELALQSVILCLSIFPMHWFTYWEVIQVPFNFGITSCYNYRCMRYAAMKLLWDFFLHLTAKMLSILKENVSCFLSKTLVSTRRSGLSFICLLIFLKQIDSELELWKYIIIHSHR